MEYVLPGGVKLAWDTEETIRSFHGEGWRAPGKGAGRISLAFQADSPAGVDAAYTDLVGRGHESELAPFDAPWGQRYAVVRDPDGNGVDLFAPLV
ncbi:putative glyoxalase superfamily protein PhnB [Crossiella equi]|uniref:Glyoxalase superfamily protein PhnB n=1 Tax=Crossiella equi TaxID=130796 RepID=A0ABS5A988_9PSEU|nr:putative glyoxalase superfamily protein PhnB [Crossiella equi]